MMNGASLTPEQKKRNALKQVLPEVFADGKVDWEKLKATLRDDINFCNERYELNSALLFEDEMKIYFVAETKDTNSPEVDL